MRTVAGVRRERTVYQLRAAYVSTNLGDHMKILLVSGALALSVALTGVAFAADMPASAPPPPPPVQVVDPITGIITTILTPVGAVVNGVAQPVGAVVNGIAQPIGDAFAPPPPPPAPVVVYHHHHRHHHHHM